MSYMTDSCWSPARPGVFFTTKMDGGLDVWDIFYKQHEPTLSMQVHNDGLYSVSVEPQGQMLTTGSVDGSIYLLELSRGLTELQRNEKSAVTQMFERESKREKNLEARAKELRNKKKQDEMNAKKAGEGDEEKAAPWENKVKEVEEEFWAAIQASDAKEL